MPLFRRPDGDLVRGEAPVRRIMPYLMRGRNESAVYHTTVYDIAQARRWLKAYNRSHAQRATLFHLFTYACAQALHERPGLNRFASGGRVYQRRGVSVAFAAKKEFDDRSPLTTIKLEMPRLEPFAAFVARMVAGIDEGRSGPDRPVDKEVSFFIRFPGFLLTFFVGVVRWLDRMNLLPWFMMRNDPMYASLFLANLGSIGVSETYHHLYEYGTCSIFGVLSAPGRRPFAEGDRTVFRECLPVHWTFDERINDGFYCARSLAFAQSILENPDRYLGTPQGTPAELPAPRPPSA